MTKTNEDYVRDFHEAFGAPVGEEPTVELLKLRRSLVSEETQEFFEELDLIIKKIESGKEPEREDYERLLKEMADVQVVLSGTSVSIKQLRNFHEAFKRVHESNMSKLGEDGKPIYREDGKVLKGPNYKGPNLDGLI